MAIVVECCGFVAFFFFRGWEKVLNSKWAGPSAAPRRDRVEIEKNGSRGGQEAIHPHGGIAWSAAPDNPGFRGVKT